jgi:D-alanyl-lipoteichoic acid acyltransferase DltB (MBOAT superfamily)
MAFSSFPFLLCFLPIVALGYAAAGRFVGGRWPQLWLLAASLLFYSYGRRSDLFLLGGSILFNWAAGRGLTHSDERTRLWILRVGLAANILFLCSFKYVSFLLGNLGGFHLTLPDWRMPLGLSFFTLTQIMYLVDTYQGLNTPHSLFDHATFVALFPYISSGPLVRARTLMPQLRQFDRGGARWQQASQGLFLCGLGLAKKVILADSFAAVADAGFGSAAALSTLEAWIASFAYSLQIYLDFSGYSDMAVGAALLLGIDIPQNFNDPYRSRSISEFWQRWHISLSNFITNYLYTPILRSMGSATLRTSVVATLLAMGIAGLWHGPAWTFIIFGLLHGVGLSINQIWRKKKLKMPDWLGRLTTVVFVNITFVFFRSHSVGAANHMLASMLPHLPFTSMGALGAVLPLTPYTLLRPVAIGTVAVFWFKSSLELSNDFRPTLRSSFATVVLILLSFIFINSTEAKPFVYFAF